MTGKRDEVTSTVEVDVAHEALIRHWGRLQAWLDESRVHASLLRRICADADRYDNTKNKNDALTLRGTILEEALRLTKVQPPLLSEKETKFIRRCQEWERRKINEAKRRMLWAAGAAVVFAVVAIFAFWQSRVSTVAKLAAQSLDELSRDNTDLATTLALRAADYRFRSPLELRALSRSAYSGGRTRLLLPGHGGNIVTCVAIHGPEHKLRVLSGSSDGSVKLWNGNDGELICPFDKVHRDEVTGVAFLDESRAISASEDGLVVVWDLTTEDSPSVERKRPFGNAITALDAAPDQTLVLLGTDVGELVLWNLETDAASSFEKKHFASVLDLDLSHDARLALSCSEDGYVFIWDVPGRKWTDCIEPVKQKERGFSRIQAELAGHTQTVRSVRFVPNVDRTPTGEHENRDETHFLTTCDDRHVRYWSLKTKEMEILGLGNAHSQSPIHGLDVHPMGRSALTGSTDNQILHWDLESPGHHRIGRFRAHRAPITCVAFHPNPRVRQFVSGSEDGTIRVWDLAHPANIAEPRSLGEYRPCHIRCSGDDHVWVVTTGGTMEFQNQGRHWRLITSKQEFAVGPRGRSFCTTPDGKYGVAGSETEGIARLWDLESNQEDPESFEGVHTASQAESEGRDRRDITSVDVSPNGSRLLTASRENSIALWNLKTREPVWKNKKLEFPRDVWSVAFVDDDRAVVATEKHRTEGEPELALWDLNRQTMIHPFRGHEDAVYSIALEPNRNGNRGKPSRMVTASADRTAILWDIESGEVIRRFFGHTQPVSAIAFGPQGNTILTGSEDRTVRLWDTSSGLELFRFDGHESTVYAVGYTDDANTLISCDGQGKVIFWRRLSLDQLVEWTRNNRYVMDEIPSHIREAYKLNLFGN